MSVHVSGVNDLPSLCVTQPDLRTHAQERTFSMTDRFFSSLCPPQGYGMPIPQFMVITRTLVFKQDGGSGLNDEKRATHTVEIEIVCPEPATKIRTEDSTGARAKCPKKGAKCPKNQTGAPTDNCDLAMPS